MQNWRKEFCEGGFLTGCKTKLIVLLGNFAILKNDKVENSAGQLL
jgi:hypothetical protein